jgi:hypothetical protein
MRQSTMYCPLRQLKISLLVGNSLTDNISNGYLGIENKNEKMFKKLRELYQEYKPYVRVDLIMYAVLILLIILYGIYTAVFS